MVTIIGAVLFGLILLAGCGNTQADLSGTYFYVQNDRSHDDMSGNGNILHQVIVKRVDKSNKKYDITEIGMYGNGHNTGTLDVDGDIMNSKLAEESFTLDTGLDNYPAGGWDISNLKGTTFTFKNGILTVSKNDKVKFYKADTSEGKKYQEIFLGQKTWHQIFDTPAPVESSENISNEETKAAGTDESSEVTFSDVKYNPENGKMSLKVKNNSDYFIDSVTIYGTMKRHETNGYGEDETTNEEFNSIVNQSSILGKYDLTAIGEDTRYAIYHIDKGEEKEFTFSLNVGDDPSIYSDPEINADKTAIIYRGKEINTGDWYQALDSDYELKTNNNAAGEIESVTIKNTSDYQWENVIIHHEYAQRYGDDLKYTDATQKQVDIGATVTIENLGGTTGNYGHATRIMYVVFEPRKK